MKRITAVICCLALVGCGTDRPNADAPAEKHKAHLCLLVMPMDLMINGSFNDDKLVFVRGFCSFGEEDNAIYATRDDMVHRIDCAAIELRPDKPITPEQWKALRLKSGSWMGVTGTYHSSGGSDWCRRRGVIDVTIIVENP